MKYTMKLKKRYAIGSQVSALFFVLIVILGFSTYLIFAKNNWDYQSSKYNIQQVEFEKGLENITIIGNPFNKTDQLDLQVMNIGNIDIQLSWIMISDPETNEQIIEYTKLDNLFLRPYQKTNIYNLETKFKGAYNETQSYQIQLITKRGTILEVRHPRPIPLPKIIMTQVIGPFFFDVNEESFKITTQDNSEPVTGYEMRDDVSELMFWIQVTNYGDESIELNGLSYIELIIHEVEGACSPYNSGCFESEVYFYLVDPASDGTDIIPYNKNDPIVLGPDESTTLKFAASQAYTSFYNPSNILQGYPPHDNDDGTENLLWSYIALFWKYTDSSRVFGKTIPFTAIHLKPY